MKKIASMIFAMFMGIALMVSGGVLLSGCSDEKLPEKSSVLVGDNEQSNKVEGEATLPNRNLINYDATGGSFVYPRGYQISRMYLTNYGYGFETNANGYLESQNKGVNNSFAMVKIEFYAEKSSASFTIKYISYGESNYDYAIFGNLDQTLTESYTADTTYFKRTYGESSSEEKTITYSGISSGSHYIYVKFRKDGSGHYYNDSVQIFFEHDFSNNNLGNGTWKYQFSGMKYGTLPTATREGYEFKGWYVNQDDNLVASPNQWKLYNGATYNSSTGEFYLPNLDSVVESPLIYVGDTNINSHLTWYASADFMCPTAASSSTGNMFQSNQAYFDGAKQNYSGNGWAGYATPNTWTNLSFSWGSAEYLGSGNCQYIKLSFVRSAEWANEPYYVKNVRFWISDCDGRKVESNQTVESFTTLYARWEPKKYTVSFDAPNLFEDAGYVMYRCGGDVTQWVNEFGQQRTTVTFTEWTEDYSCGIYFYSDKLIAGEKYLWRAEVKSTRTHDMSIGYEMGGYTSVRLTTEWQIFNYEFTATDTGGVPAFSFYYGFSVGETLDIAGMTVQKKSDVSFDQAVESLKKSYNTPYGYLPEPTRTYYTFEGWKNNYNYYTSTTTTFTYDTGSTWRDGWNFCNLKDLGIYLTNGKTYRMSFDMRLISGTGQSWHENTLYINGCTRGILTNEDGSTSLRNVTTSWQRYTGTFIYQADTISDNTSYRLDSVHIYPNYSDTSLQGQITNIEIVEENFVNSSTTLTPLGNHILKAQWRPVPRTHTVHLMTISMDGKSVTESNLGGSVAVYRYSINGSTSSSGTYYQSESTAQYTVHQGYTFELTARANSGYVFAGFSTNSSPSDAIRYPNSPPSTGLTNYPTSGQTYYVYFKKLSENRLKYDEEDKYFYFEDGEYPQSYACWYNPSLHTDTGETIEICDPSGEFSSLKIYRDSSGQRYALVVSPRDCTLNVNGWDRPLPFTKGEKALFKFEPIRWRVSDYGVEKTERNIARYSTLLQFNNYTSYSSYFIAVSDLILGVGAMHNTRNVREGDSVAGMTGFQNIQNTANGMDLKVHYNLTDDIITIDNYSDYDQWNTVIHDGGLYEEPLRICSTGELEEVGFVNRGAKASDMVCLLLGLDTDQVSYWTRDLSNLGAGIAITPTGTQIRPWLDEMLGVRFAYTFREGSNANYY